MHHPNDPDVSWWPVHRMTGHHGLTVQTWQRLTLDGGWGAVSTAQARPTRLRGQQHTGRGLPSSNVSLSQPMASAPCILLTGIHGDTHWPLIGQSPPSLASDWLVMTSPESLMFIKSVSPVSPVTWVSPRCSVTLTHMSRTSEAGCDVLWRPRHSPGSWRHTQQLPSPLLLLRMLIITNYPAAHII